MKKVVVRKKGELVIEEADKPRQIADDSVLLKVEVGGICGSDMHILHGLNPFATYPRVIGHEFGGMIVETGDKIGDLKVGERACVNPVISCGGCRSCRGGRPNICVDIQVLGVHRDGGFAEYVEVNRNNIVPYPVELDSAYMSMVEPYSIASNILNRMNFPGAGEAILIFGAGVIGLTILEYALALGGRPVVVDIADDRLAFAGKVGAVDTLNSKNGDVQKRLAESSGNSGFPYIVDAACVPSLLPLFLETASFGGVIGLLGFLSESYPVAELNIIKKELTIVGSRLNNNRFGEVLRLMKEEKLKPESLISHRFPLADFRKATQTVEARPAGLRKVVIDFT